MPRQKKKEGSHKNKKRKEIKHDMRSQCVRSQRVHENDVTQQKRRRRKGKKREEKEWEGREGRQKSAVVGFLVAGQVRKKATKANRGKQESMTCEGNVSMRMMEHGKEEEEEKERKWKKRNVKGEKEEKRAQQSIFWLQSDWVRFFYFI